MQREMANPVASRNDAVWRQMTLLMQSLGMQLHVSLERGDIQRTLTVASPKLNGSRTEALTLWLMRAAQSVRIRLVPIEVSSNEAWNLLADGFTLVAVKAIEPRAAWWILESVSGHKVSAVEILDAINPRSISASELKALISQEESYVWLLAQPALLNEASVTQLKHHAPVAHPGRHPRHDQRHSSGHGHSTQHSHLSPLRRMMALLKSEHSDLFAIAIFSFVSVILGLATPLTIEVLVNTIGFGRNFQPIFVLSLVLLAVLFLSSAFKLLQIIVVELMQRRFFVRLVGDLAYRLPNANRSALEGIHGPELVNRFFDIMTIQKSIASLMLDGVTIIMQTLIGTLLLAFYHPYLLAFDVVLMLCMTLITYFLGRGGVRTAIQESLVKYSVAHWLQDVIACPTAFKLHGGSEMCMDRTNRLTVDYLIARRRHFLVLFRQIVFALILLPIALTSLFALGGYLVVTNQLTLGQLVAAELVVGVIVGAFAKSGKTIESFYDLMAGTEKVGHLLDLPVDPPIVPIEIDSEPVSIRVEALQILDNASHHTIEIGDFSVAAGERMAIVGTVGAADSMVLPAIAGFVQYQRGFIEIGGLDARDAIRFSDSSLIGYAGSTEIFAGTISENVRLGRSGISDADLRDALETVELWDEVLLLADGLNTRLQTRGFPLCEDQLPRLAIARAIVAHPRALLIDWALDALPSDLRYRIWDRLRAKTQPWTLLITTHDDKIIQQADKVFRLEEHS